LEKSNTEHNQKEAKKEKEKGKGKGKYEFGSSFLLLGLLGLLGFKLLQRLLGELSSTLLFKIQIRKEG